jgi:hypothetical protein
MIQQISQAEIEQLPENPPERFVGIEEICRNRLYEATEYEQDWAAVQDARLRYMSTVIAAARYLKISPICDIEVPKRSQWDEKDYQDFVSEIHFYIVQLMMAGAERNSSTSIHLQGSTRDRLLTLTSHLREQVRRLDLPSGQIERLIRRIDAFETELQNPKLQFAAIAALSLAIAAGISDVGGAATTIRQLVNQVEETLGIAKDEQDKEAAGRMVQQEIVKQLTPPRKNEANKMQELNEDITF